MLAIGSLDFLGQSSHVSCSWYKLRRTLHSNPKSCAYSLGQSDVLFWVVVRRASIVRPPFPMELYHCVTYTYKDKGLYVLICHPDLMTILRVFTDGVKSFIKLGTVTMS
jgi:hypothetical protein